VRWSTCDRDQHHRLLEVRAPGDPALQLALSIRVRDCQDPTDERTVVGTSVSSGRRVTYIVVNVDVDDVALTGGNSIKRVLNIDIKVDA
jgi:hypothetical protein